MSLHKFENKINRNFLSEYFGGCLAISKNKKVIDNGRYFGVDSIIDKKDFIKLYKKNSEKFSLAILKSSGENIDNRFGFAICVSDDDSIFAIQTQKDINSFCYVDKIFNFVKEFP